MSGHNKWAKVKRYKGALDQKRGQVFSRLSKEIQLAAKSGGDPDTNLRLRTILAKAKEVSMPADTIKRAINKGTGAEAGAALEEMLYEGYGPAGVAILVEAVSDNRNRTAADIRSVFSKYNGNMGESGSVSFLFDKKGLITIKKDAIGEDDLMGLVLDAGAEDLKTDKADIYEVTTPPEAFDKVKKALEDKKLALDSAEITMIPKTTVPLDEKKAESVLKLYDALDEHDDVQNVYANFEISDEIMAKLER
ncbi:MAG TPA: YebC/PmpR family DNA-binding transcriptional regulator [bacterium]|nr:YebC/PmpR family DNA-binding transcriptional regulator [bacterium]